MEQYNVTGMSCAACSSRVEGRIQGSGVTSCSVSLLTNSMGVEELPVQVRSSRQYRMQVMEHP